MNWTHCLKLFDNEGKYCIAALYMDENGQLHKDSWIRTKPHAVDSEWECPPDPPSKAV